MVMSFYLEGRSQLGKFADRAVRRRNVAVATVTVSAFTTVFFAITAVTVGVIWASFFIICLLYPFGHPGPLMRVMFWLVCGIARCVDAHDNRAIFLTTD